MRSSDDEDISGLDESNKEDSNSVDKYTINTSQLENKVNINNDDNDDWGEFGEATSTNPPDDDEWGDFDQSRQVSASDFSESINNDFPKAVNDPDAADNEWEAKFVNSSTFDSEEFKNLVFLDNIWDDDIFWDDLIIDSFDFNLIDEVDDVYNIYDRNTGYGESFSMWLALREIEEALSLKYEWKESLLKTKHLEALNIYQSCSLKNSPTDLLPDSILLPKIINPKELDPTDDLSQSVAPNQTSDLFPVADFDWEASGIEYPMKEEIKSSAILDFDFLTTNDNAYSNSKLHATDFWLENRSVFENEKTTNDNVSMKDIPKSTNELSLDASAILQNLPNLQYLQSKLLSFPIGSGFSAVNNN